MRVVTVLLVALILNGQALGQASNSENAPRCVADAKWSNSSGNLSYSRSSALPISLSLLVHLSRGSGCSNAEVTFSATYLTESQDFICSGTIFQAMNMRSEVQTFNLEVRPSTQLDFLRWRNEPTVRGIQQGKRLVCMNLDGSADVGDTDRQKAAWIRLSAAVRPSGGGLAVTEAIVRVNP